MELTIEKLVYGGEGLARVAADGERAKTVFVPFVLPQERVEASLMGEKPGFARARLERVLQPSQFRSEPPCPYFGRCGGCQYQHIDYNAQLRFKAEILRETLRRTAKMELASEIELHASPPLHYRNRTRFHIRQNPQFTIGYFRGSSHELLPVRECPISSPLINSALVKLWELGETGKIPQEIAEAELFANESDDRLLLQLYLNRNAAGRASMIQFAEDFANRLPQVRGIVGFHQRTFKTASGTPEILFGEKTISYNVADRSYLISAGAFFQTNRHLLPTILDLVTKNREGKLALDLYSGVGFFAVPLAQHFAKVMAVESSPVSAADLRLNARGNLKVSSQSTEAYLTSVNASFRPDFVVLDPPRTGLGNTVCSQLNKLSTRRMTYVSCDPATLARDLLQLAASGWRISEIHLLDLFPQTFHIETCVMLER